MKRAVFTMQNGLYNLYKNSSKNVRLFCIVSESSNSTETTEKNAKPFKDIPGPKGVFGIGTLYKYFPIIGKTNHNQIYEIFVSI